VVGVDEFLPKIGAAIQARKDEGDEDFFLIARTDAARTLGLEEAIERARSYRKAGADGIFLTGAPKTKEGLRRVFQSVDAPFLTLPAFDHGLTVQDYKEIGAKILTGIEGLVAAAKAVTDVYRELKETGFVKEPYWHLSTAMPEISKTLKAEKWKAMGSKYESSQR
jgi:methylisocitrate lyase